MALTPVHTPIVNVGWSPAFHFELEAHLFPLKLSECQQIHRVHHPRVLILFF